MSVPRALLLVLALVHATGLAGVMREQTCKAECRSNGCGDDCTPGNESPACSCHCPSLQTQVPPHTVVTTVVPATQAAPVFDGDDSLHLSPDPREISHVPRHVV